MLMCLVGYSGCGKNTIADAYMKEYPGRFDKVVDVSDLVKKLSKQDESKLGEDLRENESLMSMLLNETTKNSIVIGIRENYLITSLKKKYDNKVMTVYLSCPEEIRFSRILNSRDITFNQLIEKDIVEREIGLSQVVNGKHIDYVCPTIQNPEYAIRQISVYCSNFKEVKK